MSVTVDIELAKRYKEPNDGYIKYLGAKVELISLFDGPLKVGHMQSVLDRGKRKSSFVGNVCIMLD